MELSVDLADLKGKVETLKENLSIGNSVLPELFGYFYEVVETQNITACGFMPITSLITYAKGMGVKEAKLLSYHNSGDITGDDTSVVGYAAATFKK